MPEARVKLLGELASLAGAREFSISLREGDTLQHVLDALIAKSGAEFHKKFWNANAGSFIPPPPQIYINGERISGPFSSIRLRNGDEVTLMPAVAGG